MTKQAPARPSSWAGSSAAQLALLDHLELPSIPGLAPCSCPWAWHSCSQSRGPAQLILGDTVSFSLLPALRPGCHGPTAATCLLLRSLGCCSCPLPGGQWQRLRQLP